MDSNEEQMVQLIRSQDETGIRYLLQHYGGLMKSVSQRHLYHLESHIDECMNDALLAVWNHIEDFNPSQSSFKNWVLSITRFKAIDLLRKHSKEKHEACDEHPAIHEDQHQQLWEEEWNDLIKDLNDKDQQLMTLVFVEGYSVEDAARMNGTSRDNVYNRISRARKKLRRHKDEHLQTVQSHANRRL
ncbi:sigma-70 family RNA polymerase sigma factor [Salinicoccus cyprini]|uniref:Sigma-70 family RNA polymerase sigma factor n=1 Tax=Salinicoccus cyprini TaxID=2493691 RepID=A0A558AUZ0_9STAP|nr:sigma-70 family RNA polymerase sigma factor [Salinicoccus cyprini]TVT28082.1 sigma-70 family RNA polymerase sigma factor [Salinicoccus cyprini]